MIIRIGGARNSVFVFKEDGLVLARVSGVEAVEVIEPEPAWPVIERADFARFPRRRVVVLPDPGGSVTVLSQYLRDSPSTLRNDAGVAIVAGGEFGDNSSSSDVVITAC